MPPSRTPTRWSTGKWIAAILAISVHVGFIVFLIFSVTWQNSKPEPVSVELYAPPAEKAAPPKPAPEPPPPEPPKPQPEPPKLPPEPAPEPPKPPPKAEPPQPSKADITLKEKQERERQLKEEKDRKDADKRDADRKKQEEKRLAEVRERQAREADALKAQAERESSTLKKAADAARSKANDAYIRSIQAKVKGNVNVPPDIAGNPEAVFEVLQLPTGEIIDTQLKKSSGVRAYDDAVYRAILKSSPLPRPESQDLFQRSLTLRFRPSDQ